MISGRRHMLLLCAGLIACSIITGCGTGGARPDEVRSSPSDEDSAREGGRRVDHRATTSGTAGTSEASAAAPTSPAVVPPGYVGIWSGPASGKFRVIAVEINQNGDGSVNTQVGNGQVFKFAVTWQTVGSKIAARMEPGGEPEVAHAELKDGALLGEFTSPLQVGDLPKRMTFSGFTKSQ